MSGIKSVFKWIAIAIGGLIGVIVVGLMGVGVASETGVIPSTAVQTGEELPEKQYAALRKAKILNRNEAVKFYYSEGLFKVTYGGSILTDQRILGYWTEEDEIKVLAYPLETIGSIEMIEEGGEIVDSEYVIFQRGEEENSLLLFLSVEDGRHLEMVEALRTQIEKNNAAHSKDVKE